jgi:hypothetical protein
MPENELSKIKRINAENKPRAYDLLDREEFFRLARECAGYLHTCHDKHGTDWEGRKFAMDALEAIWKGRIIPK